MASSARIDELRKKFDENPRRYFAPLANEYRKAGDLEQAIFICQEYLPQQPGHMSGHIVYGQALYELSRLDESRHVFETALSLDPENLIALRHLGDIARQTGDSKSARAWYQRVLEADPRNEEIAQVMMTLLATPAGQQPAIDPSLMATGMPDVAGEEVETARPTAPTGIRTVEGGFVVEKSPDGSDLAVGPELTALPERQPTPAVPTPAASPPAAEWSYRSTIPDEELLDINDFSVGGVLLSDLGATPSIDEPPPESFAESTTAFVADTAPAASPEPTMAEESSVDTRASDFEFSEAAIEKDISPFEADPYAIAGAPMMPPIESATDITLGLPDDDQPPSLADAHDETVLGLESYEHGVAAPAEEAVSLEFDSFFATPASEPQAKEVVASFTADTFEPDVVRSFDADQTDSEAAGFDAPAAPIEAPSPVAEESVAPTPVWEPAVEPTPTWEPSSEPTPVWQPAVDAAPPVEPQSTPWQEPAVAESLAGDMLAEAPEEAFVTETMAELYLQQGHLEAALEIYQKLAHQHPDDPQIADRLRVIADRVHLDESAPERDIVATSAAATSAAGPTIREFLISLVLSNGTLVVDETAPLDAAFQSAAVAPVPPDPSDEFYVEHTSAESTMYIDEPADMVDALPSIADEFSDADVASTTLGIDSRPVVEDALLDFDLIDVEPLQIAETPEAPAPRRPTPTPTRGTLAARGTPSSAGETVSGSIDALFTGADASSTDTNAASTLAQVFPPEPPDLTPLQGVPAHKASSELSLDHVFKTGQAPRPESESDGFSFDQFFADDLGDGPAKAGGEPPAAQGRGADDIAQFNNWLNGLKKT